MVLHAALVLALVLVACGGPKPATGGLSPAAEATVVARSVELTAVAVPTQAAPTQPPPTQPPAPTAEPTAVPVPQATATRPPTQAPAPTATVVVAKATVPPRAAPTVAQPPAAPAGGNNGVTGGGSGCGSRGGPGYRLANGKCASWEDARRGAR